MSKRVLVIAAHPDDELLGCGGTVALHTKKGDDVYTIIACEGESVRYGVVGGVSQNQNTLDAADVLGVKKVFSLNYPDQKLDDYVLLEIIQKIEAVIDEVRPNIVYCQFGGDSNQDHKRLFEAALVATRPTNEFIESIYTFYTGSSTEWGYPRSFAPDTWVDIEKTINTKLDAFMCYKSEVKEYPHPRSREALEITAKFFGSQCNLKYAEVFMTIRRILRK